VSLYLQHCLKRGRTQQKQHMGESCFLLSSRVLHFNKILDYNNWFYYQFLLLWMHCYATKSHKYEPQTNGKLESRGSKFRNQAHSWTLNSWQWHQFREIGDRGLYRKHLCAFLWAEKKLFKNSW
jgi:hypothetical protein